MGNSEWLEVRPRHILGRFLGYEDKDGPLDPRHGLEPGHALRLAECRADPGWAGSFVACNSPYQDIGRA